MISSTTHPEAVTATPLLPSPPAGPPPLLTATVVDDVLVLATREGEVAVRVPLVQWIPMPRPVDDGASGTIARVCALDSALARRLFRRVSAWRPDESGNLSARVRPTA